MAHPTLIARVGDRDGDLAGIMVPTSPAPTLSLSSSLSPAALEGGLGGGGHDTAVGRAAGAPLAEAVGEGGWAGLAAGHRGGARQRPTLGLGRAGVGGGLRAAQRGGLLPAAGGGGGGGGGEGRGG